jgi:hypothetical protein
MHSSFNEFYKMNHKNRGYAVIINNYNKFENSKLIALNGQTIDVKNYIETFKIIGFKDEEIKVYENQTAFQMKETMKKYASKDYTSCDCFIGVFLSHGYLLSNKQYIMGTDQGAMFEEHLTDVFRETESLYEKPKIFFIDCCRGDQYEPIYSKSIELNNKGEDEGTETTRYLHILFVKF